MNQRINNFIARMNNVKTNAKIIVIIYLISIFFNWMFFNAWDSNDVLISQLFGSIAKTLFFSAIIWSVVNGVLILKSKAISNTDKLPWFILSSVPILVFIFYYFI